MKKGLEKVFTINGVPEYTFVEPREYTELIVALKTPGRGIVVEGPSGIGKTTAIVKAIQQTLKIDEVLILTPRRKEDIDYIKDLPNSKPFGTIVIDDFHRLDKKTKSSIADLLKVLADTSDTENKLVILGINKAGENLISFGTDLNTRIEIITFGTNTDEKIEEVLKKGEKELNIKLNVKDEIIKYSNGSFYLAQMLAYYSCIESKVIEEQDSLSDIKTSFELVNGKVFDILKRKFHERTLSFVRGTKLRKEGRAPYLQLLYHLAKSKEWYLNINQLIIDFPQLKGSISQVLTKGYLKEMISNNDEFKEVLFLEEKSSLLVAQDPQFIYYLKFLPWSTFSKEAGYLTMNFDSIYDFALSFAGSNRNIAEKIFAELQNNEFEVFYDFNEQYRIIAEDIEDYLRPIYRSEASLIIVIIGPDYPKRVWTQFESQQFKHRFQSGSVIPIVLSNVELSAFDITNKIGYLKIDLTSDLQTQINSLVEILIQKIGALRLTNK
ncbi:MAG TPA: TIR domain-containing protein [Bacteroidales bacterium]|nr:TIR domain-containing protein [Bacteroidales bacterium]